MAKDVKKGKKGAAVTYVTRSQAIRKLQLSLKDFRRLCILKGIYPKEPSKKVRGNDKTYYHVKDIRFLLHEPLVGKFREIKAFNSKIRKALGRNELNTAKQLENRRPTYHLDRLVKERYPTFVDALRDLDDALCLLFLFATMPQTNKIQATVVAECQTLSFEFMNYVCHTHSLRKTFVSIKGIYYQAEIMGQQITWIVPHSYAPTVPHDVDYRVMLTFLEFYRTLLKFVNFKLYEQIGFHYPPKIDLKADSFSVGLSAMIFEAEKQATNPSVVVEEVESTPVDSKTLAQQKGTEKRLLSLRQKMKTIEASSNEVGGEEETTDIVEDTFEEEEGNDDTLRQRAEEEKFKNLFAQKLFFIQREVARTPLEFVIRSFGGQVAFPDEGSPFLEKDAAITHQIVDRPRQKVTHPNRIYIQPQWIFDCVNARMLLPTERYQPGAPLPAHLSPFVDDEKEGYKPAEKEYLELLTTQQMREEARRRGELGSDDELQQEEEVDDAATDEEAHHAAEIEAEFRKQKHLKTEQEEEREEEPEEEENEEDSSEGDTEQPMIPVEGDERELQKIMMTRQNRRLYNRIQYSKARKQEHIENLTKKRKLAEQPSSTTAPCKNKRVLAEPSTSKKKKIRQM